MPRPDWIAVDWGTSRLRAWSMGADGEVLASTERDAGMGSLAPAEFEGALLDAIGPWLGEGPTLVLACGMVGARQGWAEAAYSGVPCPPLDPARLTRAPASDPRLDVRILPGLCQNTPPDVMRGEETQIAGLLAARPGFEGTICLPGTHTKWVAIRGGQVTWFNTAMTGELFALLSESSVLRHSMDAGWDADAFDGAARDALADPGTLLSRLFAIRAAGLLTDTSPGVGRAALSGALIGAEIAGARPEGPVILIGAEDLAALYRRALGLADIPAEIVPSDQITLAGLRAARAAIEEAS